MHRWTACVLIGSWPIIILATFYRIANVFLSRSLYSFNRAHNKVNNGSSMPIQGKGTHFISNQGPTLCCYELFRLLVPLRIEIIYMSWWTSIAYNVCASIDSSYTCILQRRRKYSGCSGHNRCTSWAELAIIILQILQGPKIRPRWQSLHMCSIQCRHGL